MKFFLVKTSVACNLLKHILVNFLKPDELFQGNFYFLELKKGSVPKNLPEHILV